MNTNVWAPRHLAAAPFRSPSMTWTDARIAQISRLWAQGLSANDIAEALGDVSRSAVLGKLHRLRLLRSRKAASPPRSMAGAPQASDASRLATPTAHRAAARGGPPEPARSPWREAAFAPLAESRPRPWLSRERGQCAFPVCGEGEDLWSCCAPVEGRSAYCPQHHRIVFRRTAPLAAAAEPRRPADDWTGAKAWFCERSAA